MSSLRAAAEPIPPRLLEDDGGLRPDACIRSADGSVLLVRQPFAAAEGRMGDGTGLRIGLLVGGGGLLHQRTALGTIDGRWRVGETNVALPGCPGEYRSPALDLLGLVVDLPRFRPEPAVPLMPGLEHAAARLHADPVVAAVLHALWQCADANACSAAFFDHGVDIVLRRLASVGAPLPARRPPARPLPRAEMARVQAFIEQHLGEDISVARMAREVARDASGFSRGFTQASGMTPYAYLTWRRMEAAKQMLQAGQPVTGIALAVGYANPGKFAAAFRRVVGQAPSAWRR
jgi:AraC family transcriptional regulator